MSKTEGWLYRTMLNPIVGKWCLIFWVSVLVVAWLVTLAVLIMGLASHVGWIGAIVILVLICIGLLSIYTGFIYLATRCE